MNNNKFNEQIDEHFDKGIIEINKGKNSFKERKYSETIDHYKKAKDEFLLAKAERKFKAFECIAEIAKCKISASGITEHEIELKEYISTPYKKIIRDLKSDFWDAKRQIYASVYELKQDEFPYYYSCCNILIAICKKLEKFLYDLGLTDEASEMYFEANKEKTEKLKYEKKIFHEKWWELGKLKYNLHILGRRIFWEWLFGFFIRPWRILGSVVIGISVFSLIFWFFGFVGYQPNTMNNFIQLNSHTWKEFGHCVYFSVVSITSLGSEVHVPWGLGGRILQCIEAIFGFGILGAIVAYLTRKIK